MENPTPSSNVSSASRTIVLDIARLIKQNKISKEELVALDKEVREHALSLASELPEETGPRALRKTPIIDSSPKKVPPVIREKPLPPPPPSPNPTPTAIPVIKPKPLPPPAPVPEPKPIIKTETLKLDLETKIKALEKELSDLMRQKAEKIRTLEDIKKKEDEVEREEERIKRNIEEIASFKDKKTFEEQRWKLEDRRQELEKQRFELHNEIDVIDEKVPAKKLEIEKSFVLKRETDKQVAVATLKKDAQVAKEELKKEEGVLKVVFEKKQKYENDWTVIKQDIDKLQEIFAEDKKKLEEAKLEINALSKKEREAHTEEIRHKCEEERWALEKTMREIETAMWKTDALVEEKAIARSDLERIFASIQLEEEVAEAKINKYQMLIDKASLL